MGPNFSEHCFLLDQLLCYLTALAGLHKKLEKVLINLIELKGVLTSGVYTYAAWNPPAIKALAMNIKTVKAVL